MNLNFEQTKLVEAEPKGLSLIKGVAGSGKTTIALYRTLFLHKNYCPNPGDRILLATFTRTLVNYLMRIYEKIEEKNKDYYVNIFSDHEDKVDILTIDQIIFRYYSEHLSNQKLIPLYNNKKSNNILRECINHIKKKHKDVSVLKDNDSFLMDEINWIKACNYKELEEYQAIDRIGRTSKVTDDSPQRLPKNSITRRAIYELMTNYDRCLHNNGFIHPYDMAIKVLENARETNYKPYKHIIVDEGQDLTRTQLELLNILYRDDNDSNLNFVVDPAQSIYSQAWLVKNRSFSSVGMDMTGRSNSLTKNYRTSTQISQAAYSLLEKDLEIAECENYVTPSLLLDQQGHYPVLQYFRTEKAEADYVVNEVQKLLELNYNPGDIAIIARMKKQLECIKEYFDQAGINSEIVTKSRTKFKKDEIYMLTMHAIKGLEYRIVFIIGLNKDVIPYTPSLSGDQAFLENIERKLLYVGMTRAMEHLYLSFWGRPSKFINDINIKYLRLKSSSKIRPLYKINVDNYLFKEKLHQTYNQEEVVRQWVIRELVTTYRYPKAIISIEHQVNLFSRVGLVDVVVTTHQNKKIVPFIMIETKAPESNLNEGLEQLKSYMAASLTAQYGMVTDGFDFIVIDRKQNIIEDLPSFHQSMLPSGGETYQYTDLRSKQQSTLRFDCDSPNRVIVEREMIFEDFSGENIVQVPIFQRVAAGNPHLMNEQSTGIFNLPSEWYTGKEGIFILEVQGDSMKDASINDGDMVVVESRSKADNRDIVVVAIDDECIIKRYTPLGETVFLISENSNYEAIQVKNEQLRIIGVALGVIAEKKQQSDR